MARVPAIGMCWSRFLSTHTAMLDSFGYRKLISKGILPLSPAFALVLIAHYSWLLLSLI